jgi:hypothetical protein
MGKANPTAPRRWPEHAENHRLDAVACLLDIETLTEQAQDAIAHGRSLEATMLVRQMRRRAASAKAALFKARAGVPSDGDDLDVLEQVEQALQEGRP